MAGKIWRVYVNMQIIYFDFIATSDSHWGLVESVLMRQFWNIDHFQKSAKIWGSVAEFPYLGIWGPKYKNRHNFSCRWTNSETSIIIKKMQKKWGLGRISIFNTKIDIIRPQTPNICTFLKMIDVSELSHQYASNEPSMISQSCWKLKLCLFLCFGPQLSKYGNSAQTPRCLHFFENTRCFRIVQSIRF